VCHQTVSLVARHLEAEGIPTVVLACARDITAAAFPPRAVWCHYPLGNPAGRPFDPENQRAVIGAALELLERATAPGTIVDLPHRWQGTPGWEARVYDDRH
jgi:hypothetical protein